VPVTGTAGAQTGCRRPSRFLGTGKSQNLSRDQRHACRASHFLAGSGSSILPARRYRSSWHSDVSWKKGRLLCSPIPLPSREFHCKSPGATPACPCDLELLQEFLIPHLGKLQKRCSFDASQLAIGSDRLD